MASVFLHWFIGLIFMHNFACFVGLGTPLYFFSVLRPTFIGTPFLLDEVFITSLVLRIYLYRKFLLTHLRYSMLTHLLNSVLSHLRYSVLMHVVIRAHSSSAPRAHTIF